MRNGSRTLPATRATRPGHRASAREDATVNATNWRYTAMTRRANLARHAASCGSCETAGPQEGIYPRCEEGKRLGRLVQAALEMNGYWQQQATPQTGPRQAELF